MAMVVAASTCLLVAAVITYRSPPTASAPPVYVARLLDTASARWDLAGSAATTGDCLKQRDLKLASGLAELELLDGATVVIEGPTHLTLASPNRVVLHSGRLAATVPAKAVGFVVETPAGDVIDQGTSFGVNVAPSGVTEALVFTGEIDVLPTRSSSLTPQRLSEDSAVRMTPGSETLTVIPPDKSRFPAPARRLSLLTGGGFESGTPFLNDEVPTSEGAWSGDPCELVGPEQGIRPFEGQRMLKFVSTGNSELAGYNTGASQQWQLIDLRPLATEVREGRVVVEASARLNRVAGDELTDVRLGLCAYAFRGDPLNAKDAWERRGTERRGGAETEIPTDGDPETWEQVHIRLRVPRGSDYLLLEVRAVENVYNDATFPEFDGHYADDVQFTLRVQPRPARAGPTSRKHWRHDGGPDGLPRGRKTRGG